MKEFLEHFFYALSIAGLLFCVAFVLGILINSVI
jgi:hypothetical protein